MSGGANALAQRLQLPHNRNPPPPPLLCAGHPRLLALQRMLSLADVEEARLRLGALELRNPLMGTSALAQLLQVRVWLGAWAAEAPAGGGLAVAG